MTRLRVLIVDDEQLARERLTALFGQLPEVEVVGCATDGQEASEAIDRLRPDLVMLDIQMPEKSGLAVAADLPLKERPEIVFVTAFEQFAADAFEVEATDYLTKPVRFDRLRQAVERAKRRRALREAAESVQSAPAGTSRGYDEGIWVPVKGGSVRVPIEQIEWIEAARDYVLIHTPVRSHIHRTTMSALERRIDPTQLMRVHRSAFVRPSLVEQVERNANGSMTLTLRDGAAVPVGPSYAKSLTKRLGLNADPTS